jgi:hypothetical protein
MANCNDCWCEHYDKNEGNCDKCLRNEIENDKPDLRNILKNRAVKQMGIDKNNKSNGQNR